MVKIGNIIYEDELVNHIMVDYVNYIKEPIEYSIIDKSLPTLYVGWNFMKSTNQDNEIIQNADILKKKIITNELYWEFSFNENKSSHIKGIEKFINLLPEFYFSPKYMYVDLDPVFFHLRNVEDLMDVLPKTIDLFYQYKDEIIYALFDNKIWGINLNIYKFFQFDVELLNTSISNRCYKYGYYDVDGEIYNKYKKLLPDFTKLKRYIVTILSK